MPQAFHFFCVVPPENFRLLPTEHLFPALQAYHIEQGMRLLRSGPPLPLKGGLLVVCDRASLSPGDDSNLLRNLVQECRSRGASGLILDWARSDSIRYRLTARADTMLSQAGLSLYVPESYSPAAPHGRVLLSTALSGGSLEMRLRDGVRKYGTERVVPAYERMAEDFPLPCPGGSGTPLSPGELSALRQRLHPAIYWSEEFCAHYFTYSSGGQVHFVLFDDGSALGRKLEIASRLGISAAVGAWSEIEDSLQPLTAFLCQ